MELGQRRGRMRKGLAEFLSTPGLSGVRKRQFVATSVGQFVPHSIIFGIGYKWFSFQLGSSFGRGKITFSALCFQ